MKQGVSGSWKQRILDPVLNRCTHVLPCFYISLFFSTIKIESILTDMNSSRASSKSSGVYSLTEAQQMRAQEIREQRRALRERDGSKPPSMRFGRRIDSNTTATSAPRSSYRSGFEPFDISRVLLAAWFIEAGVVSNKPDIVCSTSSLSMHQPWH